MENERFISLILMLGLLFSSVSFAQSSSTTCINNATASITTTITVTGSSGVNTTTIAENLTCQFGCDNATFGTNQCNPDPTKPTLFVIVPPLVLFFLAFLFLYISIHIKQYQALQFLFLGSSLFTMIINAWYAQSQAVLSYSSSISSVLTPVYQMTIVVTIIVIFYFILSIILDAVKRTHARKHGLLDSEESED